MTAQWAAASVRPEVWRVPAGSGPDYAAEQDAAAGGPSRRQISLPGGGSAVGSIRLKRLPNSRRVYAYLRYSLAGKTITKYVGDATASTRPEALRKAWKLARERNLV
jgi:hypothetical protein